MSSLFLSPALQARQRQSLANVFSFCNQSTASCHLAIIISAFLYHQQKEELEKFCLCYLCSQVCGMVTQWVQIPHWHRKASGWISKDSERDRQTDRDREEKRSRRKKQRKARKKIKERQSSMSLRQQQWSSKWSPLSRVMQPNQTLDSKPEMKQANTTAPSLSLLIPIPKTLLMPIPKTV